MQRVIRGRVGDRNRGGPVAHACEAGRTETLVARIVRLVWPAGGTTGTAVVFARWNVAGGDSVTKGRLKVESFSVDHGVCDAPRES